jgi:predicted ester cyclase
MSTKENKAIIRRFIDAYNSRNLDVFDELVSEDYFDQTFEQKGREPFKQLFTSAFDTFPDWHEEIEDMVAEGDQVWVRVKATGTNTGEWNLFGVTIPPTGKKVSYRMVFNWRIKNGKMVEGGEVDDNLPFLKDLGFIEYTELGKPLENLFK